VLIVIKTNNQAPFESESATATSGLPVRRIDVFRQTAPLHFRAIRLFAAVFYNSFGVSRQQTSEFRAALLRP
jgi:hypothetical protein